MDELGAFLVADGGVGEDFAEIGDGIEKLAQIAQLLSERPGGVALVRQFEQSLGVCLGHG